MKQEGPAYVLRHHGIKGQKWGVRRTPEQLGHKPSIKEALANSLKSDRMVKEALDKGLISKRVNKEKQLRHTLGGHPKGRSYLYGGIDFSKRLINELSGTGELLFKNGTWTGKERVRSNKIIGVHVDPKTSDETETRSAMIVYSKTGAHIYPRKERV